MNYPAFQPFVVSQIRLSASVQFYQATFRSVPLSTTHFLAFLCNHSVYPLPN